MALFNSGLPGASSPPGLLPGLPAQCCCCQSGSRRRLSPGLCTPHGAGVPARPRGQGARHAHGWSWRREAEAASGCSAHRRGCGGDSGLALAPPPGVGHLAALHPGHGRATSRARWALVWVPTCPGTPRSPPGRHRIEPLTRVARCLMCWGPHIAEQRSWPPGRVAPWACEQSSVPVRQVRVNPLRGGDEAPHRLLQRP